MSKKIRVYTVTPGVGCASCTEKHIGHVMTWIEECIPGDIITVTVGEMTEAEYDKMPEYMGP